MQGGESQNSFPRPGPPSPQNRTNAYAIAALVLAFLFPVGAIICGHVARKQIRETGEGGLGIATAGLVIGYVFTAILLVSCCGLIVFSSVIANSGSTQ